MFHCDVNRITKALTVALINHQFVNNHFNIVVFITINFISMGHLTDFAVNTCIEESFFPYLFKEFPVMAFTSPDNRCKNHCTFSVELFYNQIYNLIIVILDHFFTRIIRISFSGTSKKKT